MDTVDEVMDPAITLGSELTVDGMLAIVVAKDSCVLANGNSFLISSNCSVLSDFTAKYIKLSIFKLKTPNPIY